MWFREHVDETKLFYSTSEMLELIERYCMIHSIREIWGATRLKWIERPEREENWGSCILLGDHAPSPLAKFI